MVKIRLHGMLEEVEQAQEKLKKFFNINSISAPYHDRGNSKYVRIYVDAELKEREEFLRKETG